jgi:nitrogen regulatory protein P-II 1
MKKLECIVREERLDTIIESLRMAGAPGATVSRVEGFGRQRVSAGPVLKPKVKIEIYLEDEELDTIVQTLSIAGRAGQMGDGKIAVFEVLDLVRIRTGERSTQALY